MECKQINCKRIKSLDEIIPLANKKKSLFTTSGLRMPAAFIIGMTLRKVAQYINEGLFIYKTK